MSRENFFITEDKESGQAFVKINDAMERYGSIEEAVNRLCSYFRNIIGRRDFNSLIVSCPQFSVKPEINTKVKTCVGVGTADERKAERKAQRDQELIRKARKALKDLAEVEAGLK